MNCLPTSSCTEAATAAFGACCRRVKRSVRRLAAVRKRILAACDRPTPTQSGEQLFLLARVELSVCTRPMMPK